MENTEEAGQEKKAVKTDYAGGWGILLIEVLWIFIVHNFYPVFSMEVYGDGSGSFMYTLTNFCIYLGLILTPPTVLNVVRFVSRRKKGLPIGRYITAQLVVMIVFTAIVFGTFSWDF